MRNTRPKPGFSFEPSQPSLQVMPKQEKGEMRSDFNYFVEFAVILLGISVSDMIEQKNTRNYKQKARTKG